MRRAEVMQQIEEIGIMPIIRASSTELAAQAASAVLASGIGIVEVTLSVPNAFSLLQHLRSEFGPKVLLGAGTVLDAAAARASIEAGAEFIVAPGFDIETVRAAHTFDCPCVPGVLTPTEVITAWNAGADMVKIFPCSAMGGASYLHALKAPLPHIKMMPTGGVNMNTAADFIKAGAAVLGVGASVIDLKLMKQSGAEAVTARCRDLLEAVRAARN